MRYAQSPKSENPNMFYLWSSRNPKGQIGHGDLFLREGRVNHNITYLNLISIFSFSLSSSSRSIEYFLLKWGLECREVPLNTFEADKPNLAGSDLPGNHTIHMYIIKKKTT